LINVTWDCFDQSNFYISRINIIEWNNTIYSNQLTIFVFNALKKRVGSKHTKSASIINSVAFI
jgi:hypothetical protein